MAKPVPVHPTEVNLRDHDFDTGECEYCRYFKSGKKERGDCALLVTDVGEEQVCDAFQGDDNKFIPFKIKDSDIENFAKGMFVLQPYKHIVVKGVLNTPVGDLIIIHDSMKPKPHYFSIDLGFSNEHLAREHHWTQEEVNKIIKVGKSKKEKSIMAKNKNMTISISPEEIVGSEIVKSGDYRYASLGVKKGDKEYMRISYEWQGDTVPEFVMGIMSWMSSNKEVIDPLREERASEYKELKERM